MMNSGSRNRMPGNIWVDRTVMLNTPRPGKRYRLTASAAKMATVTEHAIATPDTTTLFRKYLPSGTVCQMSTKGRRVRRDGIQRKVDCTSTSGLTDELTSA